MRRKSFCEGMGERRGGFLCSPPLPVHPEDAPTGGKCPPPKARRWAWMGRIRSFPIVSVPYGFESRYDLHDHGINLRDSGIIYKTDALHHNTVSFGNIIFDKICLINCSRSGTSRYTMNERAVFSALYGGRNNSLFYKVLVSSTVNSRAVSGLMKFPQRGSATMWNARFSLSKTRM